MRFGRVTLNGIRSRAQRLRAPVVPGSVVTVNGEVVPPMPDRSVLIMNKRPGTVCSTNREEGPSVLDDVPAAMRHPDLHTCGRLDRDTGGLLVLTTDGRINQALVFPEAHCVKRYKVAYSGTLVADAAEQVGSQPGSTGPASLR
jgi:16S rRNA U516 pseudouridylate synthase RsuA-like enzyme